jgi:hypothetical protein
MGGDSSIFDFDALQRDDSLELLVQCIAQLPLTPKNFGEVLSRKPRASRNSGLSGFD